MQAIIRTLVLAIFILLPALTAESCRTWAQSAEQPAAPATPQIKIDKRKLLVPPRNADGTIIATPFTEDPVGWMRDQQRNFYGKLSGELRSIKSSSSMAAVWTLLTLSFFYGVFHAAGPGHGKAVISGWLLATENELRRGLVIAFLSAMIQSLTAIVIVSALLAFVKSASSMARDVAGFLESASYAMIGAMGLYLVWTAFKPVHGHSTQAHPDCHGHGDHGHHDHRHDDHHDHAHAPTASAVKGDWSQRRALALAFAVGIRPCTGALLVLIFSWSLGLYWAGITATLVMGLGVFITIAVIASLAVYAKAIALRAAALDSRGLALAAKSLRVVFGLAILGLGMLLFMGSLGGVNTMM